MGNISSSFSRRHFIKASAIGAAALSTAGMWNTARAQGKRIVVRDDGGIYTKAYGEVFYKPFQEATGIEVIGVQANAEPTAQILSMVDAGSYTWDMAKISRPAIELLTAGPKRYLEPLNLAGDPAVAALPKQYVHEYGIGTNVYSTVLAYRTDAFKGRAAPASWKDYFDVANFPGRRAIRRHPFDTIEQALMADGVPTGQVYPCDLDRAFKKLDQLKKDISVFWTSGAQVEQLLISGEVDMVPTWVSRAQAAQSAGAPVGIVWEQNIWGLDNWSILAGTPNADLCREFIKFTLDPQRQAQLVKYFPAGVTQPDAFKYIDPEVAKQCPTYPEHIASGLPIDAAYWTKHQSEALDRYNAWLLS
ncbi:MULTISPECIES: extracellular solute-binding protein [unclassified Pseudomonas]|uniref:extracellular solute-binding protein n=1 Tax=unclassified Pseudomonas TaxID=196821 RepID=UPI000BD44519|nr:MULTISPECIES: extracellular solute-binding protein [unclassified Pseudomonas]PVZ19674.1 putative spermidine/putrescine transport system substrate-binding protein [Pseudomonas sp. URIL14HWK12:I12]PVZ22741.1 putative spermidine/putrescine transport system substrate-binding protein [Pseudomonas sp. URIL14HWK12:I10]PVZ37629.1 putative spermidine/putrescine transport system substrate-binding protein [Pseudomonas sp. URIL14HWK12:I11]SNZ15298.1 putative spermidine/putrescine transport system substr